MSKTEALTQVGNLPHKLGAAAAYLPIAGISVIASIIWLATEPKESEFIRYHSAQSLAVFSSWLLFTILGSLFFAIFPVVIGFLPSSMGELLLIVMLLLTLVYVLLVIAGPGLMLILAATSAMEMDIRIPILSGLLSRFV
jgi:uncharacterized membrane protein